MNILEILDAPQRARIAEADAMRQRQRAATLAAQLRDAQDAAQYWQAQAEQARQTAEFYMGMFCDKCKDAQP